MLAPWKKSYDQPRQHIKKQRHYFADKGSSMVSPGKAMVSPVELGHKEGWPPKNWCFWTVVLERTLESLLDCKEIKPVNSKGNQPLIFIGRTDAEAETLILWLPDAKSWLIGKDPDARRLKAGERDNRRWDGWMASPTQWTWVWARSRSWWRTGKPDMLQSTGSQRVGHKWVTELNCELAETGVWRSVNGMCPAPWIILSFANVFLWF